MAGYKKHNVTKTQYYGSDVDSTGKAIAPPIAQNGKPESGINPGEIAINNASTDPCAFILDTEGNVVKIGGGTDIDLLDKRYLLKSIYDDVFSKENLGTDENPNWVLRVKYNVLFDYDFAIYGSKSFQSPSIVNAIPLGDGLAVVDGKLTVTEIGGIDTEAMWNALGASTNEQINISHLSNALSGYATQTWVQNQGYLTQHQSLAGYATETWVNTQIADNAYTLPTASATVLGGVKIGDNINITNGVISTHSPYELTKDKILSVLKDANGIIELDASLVLTGDFAIYSATQLGKLPSIMDGLILDNNTLAIVDDKLTVIGGTGGGLDETELANYLTEHNYYHAGNANKLDVTWSANNLFANVVTLNSTQGIRQNLRDYSMLYCDTNGNTVVGQHDSITYIRSSYSDIVHRKNGVEYVIYDADNSNKLDINWQGAIVKANTEFRGNTLKSLNGDNLIFIGNDVNIGNSSKNLWLFSGDSDLKHNKASTLYTIWDASNANLSGVDWATYSLRSYHHIEVNSGVDTKLIFNNTDGEKYTSIAFQENGSTYANITADGRNNGTFTFSGLPVKVDTLYLNSTGNPYIDGGGSLLIPMVSTTGGEARGISYKSTSTSNPTSSAIGAYYFKSNFSHLFMGWGASPWDSATNFHVNSTEIQYKGNTVWHAGNMGAGSGLNADTLDGYHRHALFTGGIWDFLINGTDGSCYRSIVVNGDKDTYYPVVIAVYNNDNWIDNIITVSKTLGSQTPNWSGNHSGGTSSGIFRFHYRTGIWDGHGSLLNTVNRTMPYANWVINLEFAYSSVGKAVVWLRGGGAQYDIHCNNAISESNIYYTRTNIYANDTYPAWVEPKTSGNYGYVANGTASPCFNAVYLSNNENYINNSYFKIGLFEGIDHDFRIRGKRALVGTTDSLYINYGNDWSVVNLNGIVNLNNTLNISGDITLNQNGSTGIRQIRMTCGDNDYGRIAVGATGSNAGWMEIATADDSNEPIYVRQYGGLYSSITRTLILLDANGYTTLPGRTFVHAQTAYGSTPAISLAIGDSDTGFNWKSDGVIGFMSNGIERGYWSNDGNLYWNGTIMMAQDFVIYKSFSDIRLKTNLKSFDAHSLLSSFGKVVEFDYTNEALMLNPNLPSHDFNFIAQSVQKVMPQLVDEECGYLTLNLHKRQFISLLAACEVQTISKLSMLEKWKTKEEKEIDRLKKENINLRKRVSALEELVNDKTIM